MLLMDTSVLFAQKTLAASLWEIVKYSWHPIVKSISKQMDWNSITPNSEAQGLWAHLGKKNGLNGAN